MRDITNRQWVIRERPVDVLQTRHFEYREASVPPLREGEVLLETHVLNIAPVMRQYMLAGGAAGEASLDPGDVIHGRGVARVAQSRHPDYSRGDFVQAQIGWQTYKVSRMSEREKVRKLKPAGLPVHYALAVLGVTGFSAYAGFVIRGQPKPGDAVLVSGAMGGVGSLVIQIARKLGCRPVVGIAGGPAKCDRVRALGCDDCIDYQREDLSGRIGGLFPAGVDLYFDNVGGEILEVALDNLAAGARVVLCGSISEYQRSAPFGPRNYTRLRAVEADMRGFFVYNYLTRFDDIESILLDWLKDGSVKPVLDEVRGFESMPDALMGMFRGTGGGKRVVLTRPGSVAIY